MKNINYYYKAGISGLFQLTKVGTMGKIRYEGFRKSTLVRQLHIILSTTSICGKFTSLHTFHFETIFNLFIQCYSTLLVRPLFCEYVFANCDIFLNVCLSSLRNMYPPARVWRQANNNTTIQICNLEKKSNYWNLVISGLNTVNINGKLHSSSYVENGARNNLVKVMRFRLKNPYGEVKNQKHFLKKFHHLVRLAMHQKNF